MSTLRRTSTVWLSICSLAVALTCSLSAVAQATDGPQYGAIGQYGEVTRFGGFDAGAYDEDKYDGALTSGEFLNPVGFAVDTQDTTQGGDGTAVYVLDRISAYAGSTTQPGTEWRLQKLSDTDAVLGTTEFYLPKTGELANGVRNPLGPIGLTVDDHTGVIYTLFYAIGGSGNSATPYADEIVGWSTTPSAGKLVAPTGAKPDALSTPVAGYESAGLFSTSAQLSSTPLYDPFGLTVDVPEAGQDDLAIEANSNARSGNGREVGPALVEQVSPASGAETASWSAASLSGADATATAGGISTGANESLDVLLATGGTQFDAVALSPKLTSPTVLASQALDTPSEWARPLQVAGAEFPTPSASAPVVELSNELFAADYWLNGGGQGYWRQFHDEGIRLLSGASTGGALSNPTLPPGTIFDTLGNETIGGPCYIGNGGVPGAESDVTLAAGANGAIWILTAGEDSSRGPEPEDTTGRQVIELAPGAAKPCVSATGTFTVADATVKSTPQPASTSTPLTIPVGHTVEFNASTIAYPGNEAESNAATYAYEWAPTGGSYSIVEDTTTKLQPLATATYQYNTVGPQTVKLKLLGDFGEYDEEGTILVQSVNLPKAAFTAPESAEAGQKITLDASTSEPASGAEIKSYHWSFGDGQSEEIEAKPGTEADVVTHTYASPASYTITLTVRDNDNRISSVTTRKITITTPSSGGGGGNGGGGGGGGGTTSTSTTPVSTTPTTTTPVAVIDRSATNVNPRASEVAGKLQVTLSCPATKVSCAGTIQVKTASAVAAKKHKKTVLTLGSGSFSLTAGASKTLTITLSAKGAALLKKDKTLSVDVVVAAHDSYGDPLTKTLVLTLREPAPKKSSKRHK